MTQKEKQKYMKLALKEAYTGISKGHGGPFGAVIVKDGKVIAKGHNHVVVNNDPTCHGEIDTIRKACKKLKTFDLTGCELYTTSEPCPMCKGAIQWANISKVYYGCTVLDAEELGFRDDTFSNFEIPMEEVMKDECKQLFKDYIMVEHVVY